MSLQNNTLLKIHFRTCIISVIVQANIQIYIYPRDAADLGTQMFRNMWPTHTPVPRWRLTNSDIDLDSFDPTHIRNNEQPVERSPYHSYY